jgi:hypothetical protein
MCSNGTDGVVDGQSRGVQPQDGLDGGESNGGTCSNKTDWEVNG